MKSKVIVINKKIYLLLLIITITFICMTFPRKKETTINENINSKNATKLAVYSSVNETDNEENKNLENTYSKANTSNIIENKLEIQEIDGTPVIGKLEIPKINLTTYILSETNKETLDKSVTKFYGPKVNGVGNLCITGHNYHKERMFGDLKDVEIGDTIYVTETNGNTIEYTVYEINKVSPNEVECLSQDTGGERQITLITCTAGALKRLVVKAIEVYD